MISEIEVFSLHAISRYTPKSNDILISIGRSYERSKLQTGYFDVLPLDFIDADLTEDMRELKSFDLVHSLMPGCFMPEHADLIRRFAHYYQSILDKQYRLLIHCHAGVSRSAAVAKYLSEFHSIPCHSNLSQHNRYVYDVLLGKYDAYLQGILHKITAFLFGRKAQH